jgi:type II secretory pathway pseudopilin PulG
MKTIGINVGRSLATDRSVIARKRASYAAPSGPFGDGLTSACAFSLIEVVVAIGILAVTLIAVLGLLASSTRPVGEIADGHVAARLGENIQDELERLKAGLGLDGLATIVPAGGSAAPLQIVATRDGRRVLRADGADPAAGQALNDPVRPGIANRDRYYLAEVTQQLDLPYAPGAGFLAVSVRVTWPYRLPAGPPTPEAAAVDADPAREIPVNARRWAVVNFALRP